MRLAMNNPYLRRVLLALALLLIPAVMAGCSLFGRDEAGPLVEDIPYVDGGHYGYEVQNQQGEAIGEAEFVTTRTELEGDPVWAIETSTDIPGSVKEATVVYTDPQTLSPLRFEGTVEVPQGTYEITAVYGEEEISIEAETPQGPQSIKRPRPSSPFDNDQLLMLIRALPLEDGYSTKLNVVLPKNANRTSVTVKVVGQETVTAAAGEFDTWKVELSFTSGSQHVWYAVGGSRPMVKYDNGNTIFVLRDMTE